MTIFFERIKEYLDKNSYLLNSDDAYTIQFHLKPRLISGSIEYAFNKNKSFDLYKRSKKNIYEIIFNQCLVFSISYFDYISKGGFHEDIKSFMQE